MPNERAILCGGVSDTKLAFGGNDPLRLRLWGRGANLALSFEDIRRQLLREIPKQFLDLIEIATYVYCADQVISRGSDVLRGMGEDWRRRLLFRIPVRKPDLWSSEPLKAVLVETLSFLSEDEYRFEFVPLDRGPEIQKYFCCVDDTHDEVVPEEVVLFSGGLDSLAGAVQETVVQQRRVAFVRHKSTTKLDQRVRHLCDELKKMAGGAKPLHLPVSINKRVKEFNREYTQRARSFLYASIATTIAQMFGLSRIRFYENGIVSLNLPPSAQVVGARATRTTHPRVLNGFARLFSILAEKPFAVENPFLWKTKTEVIDLLAKAGGAGLIPYATSCTHVWEMTKVHTHCGTCSQCIDRRFAVLAAGCADHDRADAYKVDLLLGEPKEGGKGDPKTMLAAYVETANEVSDMSPVQFFARFGEASRILRHIDVSPDRGALHVYELHKRHAEQTVAVVRDAIASHAIDIFKRRLPPSCLLQLACNSLGGLVPATIDRSSAETTRPVNYVWRKGEYWAVRFEYGDEKIYKHETGFDYLHVLLGNPGKTYTVLELASAVSHPAKAVASLTASAGDASTDDGYSTVGTSDGGDILDSKALKSLLDRLEDLDKEREEAREDNDLGRIAALDSERDSIVGELENAHDLRGRPRKLGDERNKVRKRVCNAICRAREKIAKYDAPLAKHLDHPVLNLGNTVSYVPRTDVIWSIASSAGS